MEFETMERDSGGGSETRGQSMMGSFVVDDEALWWVDESGEDEGVDDDDEASHSRVRSWLHLGHGTTARWGTEGETKFIRCWLRKAVEGE
jgi:hypothetical protein